MSQKLKLQQLQHAFSAADKDGDDLLNREEFAKFVEIGYRKKCPPQMYDTVCSRFSCDIELGINWNTARELFVKANTASTNTNTNTNTNTKSPMSTKSPSPISPLNNTKTTKKSLMSTTKPAPSRQFSTDSSTQNEITSQHHANSKSESTSTSSRWIPPIPSEPNRNGSISDISSIPYDDIDQQSNTSQRDIYKRQFRRQSSVNNDYMHHNRRQSAQRQYDSPSSSGQDASTMIVDMLENKTKQLQQSLKLERQKRKKTEQLASQLLTDKEEATQKNEKLTKANMKLTQELSAVRNKCGKFKTQVDDDRASIKHLQEQCRSMEAERDELYELLTKIEKEHALKVKRLKQKHLQEMDKLSAGFLESLGAEPGKDVTTVIKELKGNNVELKRTVDTLAESLSRKQQSLIEALQAVDNTQMEFDQYRKQKMEEEAQQLMNDDNVDNNNNNSTSGKKGKIKDKLKKWNKRRKSIHIKRGRMGRHRSTTSESQLSNSDFMGVSDLNDVDFGSIPKQTALFVQRSLNEINDNDDDNKYGDEELNIDNAKTAKEMQMLSEKLTNDVKNKTQSVENLQMTNTYLLDQMKKMQMQIEEMENMKLAHDKNKENDPNKE